MPNEDIENIDSEIDEPTVDATGEVTLTVDDYRALEAEKKALEEKNAKLYARLKKERENKGENKPLQTTNVPEVTQELAKLRLQVTHGINDPAAIDFIMKNGGEKALENPFIKQTIDNMLAQKKAEQAAIAEDTNKSEFERKVTNDQLKAMSLEELEKTLPHA